MTSAGIVACRSEAVFADAALSFLIGELARFHVRVIAGVAALRGFKALDVGPAEVVHAFVSLSADPSANDEALLDDDERARSSRLVRPADRRCFVLAHAALRLVLAGCLRVEPAAVHYELGPHGKPRLATGLPALEFSLSHSGAVAMLAVALDRPIGVDVEHVRDIRDAQVIADAHFSPPERERLRSLGPADLPDAFLRCWTRKEAMIKAIGDGLSRPLDSFEVDLTAGSMSALTRFEGRPGRLAAWSLRDVAAPPGYVAAGAVAAGAGNAPARWRELSTDATDQVV